MCMQVAFSPADLARIGIEWSKCDGEAAILQSEFVIAKRDFDPIRACPARPGGHGQLPIRGSHRSGLARFGHQMRLAAWWSPHATSRVTCSERTSATLRACQGMGSGRRAPRRTVMIRSPSPPRLRGGPGRCAERRPEPALNPGNDPAASKRASSGGAFSACHEPRTEPVA